MPLVSSGEKMDECKFCNESNGKLWADLYFGGEWFFTTVVRSSRVEKCVCKVVGCDDGRQ